MRNTILCGDALTQLRTLPDESVHCVVTSPPYWGLRDYGTASWEGGDEGCDHKPSSDEESRWARRASTLVGTTDTQAAAQVARFAKDECPRCGATRIDDQIGLEPTPEQYVCNMVEVFREVRRVLHGDGTVWLNLGDSYAGSGRGSGGTYEASAKQVTNRGANFMQNDRLLDFDHGLKPKDLVGIPWRVAFALQADGWWLRSDIIWLKPNPMPESVTDRPTKAHEYIFLLSKNQTYYYDHEAIKEPSTYPEPMEARIARAEWGGKSAPTAMKNGIRPRRTDKQRGHGRRHAGFNDRWDAMTKEEQAANGRNKRTVWEVATHPYPEAHFATYPEDLIRPCVLAGCPENGIVLDPFFGSGTTGLVAAKAGRDWIGIELNPAYVEMAERRLISVKARLL